MSWDYYISKYFIRDIYLDAKAWVRSLFCEHDWHNMTTKNIVGNDLAVYWKVCMKCGKETECSTVPPTEEV